MAIVLDDQTEQYLLGSIRRFFAEELEDDIAGNRYEPEFDYWKRA